MRSLNGLILRAYTSNGLFVSVCSIVLILALLIALVNRVQEAVEDKTSHFAAEAVSRREIKPEVNPCKNSTKSCLFGGIGKRIKRTFDSGQHFRSNHKREMVV